MINNTPLHFSNREGGGEGAFTQTAKAALLRGNPPIAFPPRKGRRAAPDGTGGTAVTKGVGSASFSPPGFRETLFHSATRAGKAEGTGRVPAGQCRLVLPPHMIQHPLVKQERGGKIKGREQRRGYTPRGHDEGRLSPV